MSHKRTYHSLFILCAWIAVGCNTMKYVPKDDHLYRGPEWKVNGKLNKKTRSAIEELPTPKANSSLFGMPYKLWFYNLVGPPKKQKGLVSRIKRFGEAPVLLSQVNPTLVSKRIESRLFDDAYFRGTVNAETVIKGRSAKMRYTITPDIRYSIRDVIFPADSTALSLDISETRKNSILKKDEPVITVNLRSERERIDLAMKNQGYFYFSPDLILFRVDTLHEGKADVYITVKEQASDFAKHTWDIGTMSVYGNYSMQRDSIITKQKGKKEKEFMLIDNRERYKASVYERALLMKEGQTYDRELHYLSIERLMNLNTFRFVKMSFTPDTSAGQRKLDTRVFVTPQKKNSLRFEATVNTKTGNFVGSELAMKWRNVNVFKGAEVLDFSISGGFDAQLGGKKVQSPNAYTFRTDLTFYIPRIFPYFKVTTGKNSFIPRTGITLGAEYLQRPQYYTLRALKASLDWTWKYTRTAEHTVRPIRIQSIYPTNITPAFDSILAQDIALRASFEKQLIIGSQYTYQYNNTFKTAKPFTYWFRFNAGSSGNLVNMVSSPKVDTPGAVKVFNLPISQFVRLEADARVYINLSKRWVWVNRATGGTAIAYGNSLIVPYSEQFFIGGSSSVRAFRIRTLGPGTYHTDETQFQANEAGDVKIEMNTEWRYDMSRYIKLAAFMDAGNIWLRKSVPDKPGSKFTSSFLREFAVGSGIGVRLDFSVLLLRFDFAIPLRKPWLPEGQRWVLDDINFGSKEWRRENFLINIAIGYPF